MLPGPYFVITLRDPCAGPTLKAYAWAAEKEGLPEEYVKDVEELANLAGFVAVREGEGEPAAPPHRKDNPVVLDWAHLGRLPEEVLTPAKMPMKEALWELLATMDTQQVLDTARRFVAAQRSVHPESLSALLVEALIGALERTMTEEHAVEPVAEEPALHVFLIGDCDHVVAKDEEDAWGEWEELTGMDKEEVDGKIKQEPDDKVLGVLPDEGDDGEKAVYLPCAEWAKREGRGFLCSSEF